MRGKLLVSSIIVLCLVTGCSMDSFAFLYDLTSSLKENVFTDVLGSDAGALIADIDDAISAIGPLEYSGGYALGTHVFDPRMEDGSSIMPPLAWSILDSLSMASENRVKVEKVTAHLSSRADEDDAALVVSTYGMFDAVVKLRQEEQKRQQEQRQQEQQQQEPQEQTPPETPPEVIEMLCAFELSRNRNGIVIRCLVDETPIAETTCTESQRQFSDRAPKAAQEITARFAQHLKNTVPSGAKLTVRTSVRVRDPFVYYGMVTELSRVLRSSIQTFADDGVELQLGATSADGDDSAESGKE